MRSPSERQDAEQYTRGPRGGLPARSPPHTRHLAAAARFCAGRFQAARPRSRPFSLHGSEQYRTARFGVENCLPHSLQPMRCVRVASLAARSLHGSQ